MDDPPVRVVPAVVQAVAQAVAQVLPDPTTSTSASWPM
jgi:hypothetical protein